MVIQSKLLSALFHIEHGFGTRMEPIPNKLSVHWKKEAPKWKQVHGNQMVEVTHSEQNCGETDAFFTCKSEQTIGVITADCVPILLAHRSEPCVVAIHAGWRGTLKNITEKVWERLPHRQNPDQWVAAIGPAISGVNYEVGPELIHRFRKVFPTIPLSVFEPLPHHLDLPALQFALLRRLGLQAIDRLSICTFSAKNPTGEPLCHSYRREKQSVRQYSLIRSKT